MAGRSIRRLAHDDPAELLAALPSGVDPCGENGEMHTFVHDGPIFARPIDVELGEIVERDGFVFADLTRGDQIERPPRSSRARSA